MRHNKNGNIVIESLMRFDGPATLEEISAIVALRTGLDQQGVKTLVQETLMGGVDYGYVHFANNKYYVAEYEEAIARLTAELAPEMGQETTHRKSHEEAAVKQHEAAAEKQHGAAASEKYESTVKVLYKVPSSMKFGSSSSCVILEAAPRKSHVAHESAYRMTTRATSRRAYDSDDTACGRCWQSNSRERVGRSRSQTRSKILKGNRSRSRPY